ncbi:ABC transporter substrate-binding protein [Bradyrhizobium oligotrophicum]|uniref:ABC transporter substrate-binding protein n=1 Tax=Bradyrhizobium oligotrophicum TaxID=44255 RepID=UPI003EBB75CB
MTVQWSALIVVSFFGAYLGPALAAAPDAVREFAGRVGPIVGQASACQDIAQGRVQTIVDKVREVIRQASTNDGERDQLTRAFNGYIADGRSRIGASQASCANAEKQLVELERSLSQPAAAGPRPSSPAEATTGAVTAAEVRGVTDREIRFGMVLPFSGVQKEVGHEMRLGIETAFARANEGGGINGRMLRLVVADDGYDPNRTAAAMAQLYEKEQVFGFIGNIGTANAQAAIPYALERRMLFFAPDTGAASVRRDPPDRYVFNYRPSDAEEAEALVRYLVKMKRIPPRQIAVFTQQDALGDDGYAGVAKAVRHLNISEPVARFNYPRATIDVDDAVNQIKAHKPAIKAVIMVATSRAAAKFIEKTRDAMPDLICATISVVGSTALATELKLLGPRFTRGVIVTQGVPAVSGYSSLVLDYKNALTKFAPGEAPDYTSLEGYIAATILIQALKQTNPLDTERLVDTLESMRSLDLGLGAPLSFGRAEHQASHRIWGTALDENGTYQAIELE